MGAGEGTAFIIFCRKDFLGGRVSFLEVRMRRRSRRREEFHCRGLVMEWDAHCPLLWLACWSKAQPGPVSSLRLSESVKVRNWCVLLFIGKEKLIEPCPHSLSSLCLGGTKTSSPANGKSFGKNSLKEAPRWPDIPVREQLARNSRFLSYVTYKLLQLSHAVSSLHRHLIFLALRNRFRISESPSFIPNWSLSRVNLSEKWTKWRWVINLSSFIH